MLFGQFKQRLWCFSRQIITSVQVVKLSRTLWSSRHGSLGESKLQPPWLSLIPKGRFKQLLLIWKDPDTGEDRRWEEKGMTETEMVGWHHWLNGHEFEQPLGDGEGQGSLVCCSPWAAKSRMWLSEMNNNNRGNGKDTGMKSKECSGNNLYIT